MNIDVGTVMKIEKYFNGVVVGSYLFIKDGLLDNEDITDIDIMMSIDNYDQVSAYLVDCGYEIGFINKYFRSYGCNYDFVCEKDGYIPIHIMLHNSKEKVLQWDLRSILAIKIKRDRNSDDKQIVKILEGIKKNEK